jgi:hypothetical protein
MAIVYPLANGNWSSVANWYSGGVAYGQLPLSTDDVYADGKTVVIDQDITVNLLTTLQRSGGIINGTFTCTTARTINATTITAVGVVLSLTCTGITQNVITTTINGSTQVAAFGAIVITGTSGIVNVTATTLFQAGYQAAFCIMNGTGSTLNVTGTTSGSAQCAISNTTGIVNFTGTLTASGNTFGSILQNGAGGITNVTGALVGGTNSNGYCVNNFIGTVNILSNQTMSGTTGIGVNSNAGTTNFGTIGSPITITGAPSTAASGLYACYHAGNGNVNLYGNIVLQNYSFSTVAGLFRYGVTSGVMTINGNITGGTVANTIGVNNENTGTVIVNGNVTGGSHATNTPALSISQAGTFTVNGIVTSNAFPAIHSTVVTAKFNLLGNIVNTAGLVAYYGSFNVKCSPTAGQSITYRSTSGTDRILATTNVSNGAPVIANVRDGVIYGSTNELTGVLQMATPSNVRVSVPTDNTVGTATITAQDFWDYAVSNLTVADSIGKRLKNVSTVQTTGDQIAAF